MYLKPVCSSDCSCFLRIGIGIFGPFYWLKHREENQGKREERRPAPKAQGSDSRTQPHYPVSYWSIPRKIQVVVYWKSHVRFTLHKSTPSPNCICHQKPIPAFVTLRCTIEPLTPPSHLLHFLPIP